MPVPGFPDAIHLRIRGRPVEAGPVTFCFWSLRVLGQQASLRRGKGEGGLLWARSRCLLTGDDAILLRGEWPVAGVERGGMHTVHGTREATMPTIQRDQQSRLLQKAVGIEWQKAKLNCLT